MFKLVFALVAFTSPALVATGRAIKANIYVVSDRAPGFLATDVTECNDDDDDDDNDGDDDNDLARPGAKTEGVRGKQTATATTDDKVNECT